MFLAVLSYLMGRSMEIVLPSSGWFRYLNPVRTPHSHYNLVYTFRLEGSFQQEGECIHTHYVKCGRNFSNGRRGLCSPGPALQRRQAEQTCIFVRRFFKPIPRLRHCGLVEA